ncbi:MAG: hypothetical protein AMJ89_02630 [candidate division Zixibacteria bacterium SM23_73]|nr:MAG: hypothetical protein AMJ89_02630 [candidate division Zixibacteria bacterium SM23_73]
MSKKVKMKIACPQCGRKQKVLAYKSINVTLSPQLRENVFNDDINRFSCTDCNIYLLLPLDLLYHDMKRKFAVWFRPQGDVTDEEKDKIEGISPKLGTLAYIAEAPATFTWESFKKTILELEKKETN